MDKQTMIKDAIYVAILTLVESQLTVEQIKEEIAWLAKGEFEFLGRENIKSKIKKEDLNLLSRIRMRILESDVELTEKELAALEGLCDAVYNWVKTADYIWDLKLSYKEREKAKLYQVIYKATIEVYISYLADNQNKKAKLAEFRTKLKDYFAILIKIANAVDKNEIDVLDSLIDERVQQAVVMQEFLDDFKLAESDLASIYEMELYYYDIAKAS